MQGLKDGATEAQEELGDSNVKEARGKNCFEKERIRSPKSAAKSSLGMYNAVE